MADSKIKKSDVGEQSANSDQTPTATSPDKAEDNHEFEGLLGPSQDDLNPVRGSEGRPVRGGRQGPTTTSSRLRGTRPAADGRVSPCLAKVLEVLTSMSSAPRGVERTSLDTDTSLS